MPLESDPTFGVAYLGVEVFKADAAYYGADKAIASMSDQSLLRLLARASRAIDTYTGRTFGPGAISENHKWNPVNRRCKVNQPPVITLTSFRVRIGAGLTASFSVTPTENDAGGNPVRFGEIVYNRQENYLEVTSLATASNMTNQIISLGLTENWVEIVYTNQAADAAINPAVADATAWTAAHLANAGRTNSQLPAGISMVKMGEVTVQRAAASVDPTRDALPEMAKQLLRGLTRIAIA